MICPTCKSKHPHLHPAVQCGGEVEVCADAFHLTPTPQNTPAYIAAVLEKRALAKFEDLTREASHDARTALEAKDDQ